MSHLRHFGPFWSFWILLLLYTFITQILVLYTPKQFSAARRPCVVLYARPIHALYTLYTRPIHALALALYTPYTRSIHALYRALWACCGLLRAALRTARALTTRPALAGVLPFSGLSPGKVYPLARGCMLRPYNTVYDLYGIRSVHALGGRPLWTKTGGCK